MDYTQVPDKRRYETALHRQLPCQKPVYSPFLIRMQTREDTKRRR